MLTPNETYTMLGVKVSEKIIPDGSKLGAHKKTERKIGTVKFITVHNTEDLTNVYDDAEQYTRATYNGAMGGTFTHFYVDDTGAWQNLKCGLGLSKNDPKGSAEWGSHTADSEYSDGGNATSISLEVIMHETPATDKKAYDNAARMCAYLLDFYGLGIDKLVTHTYWGNKSYYDGTSTKFSDVDRQCTNPIAGRRWCPCYIFNSTNKDVAYRNWKAFKEAVQKYLNEIKAQSTKKIYRVQIGAFSSRQNAENYLAEAKKKGFTGFVVEADK